MSVTPETQSPSTRRRPEKTQTKTGDRSPDQTRPPDPQRRPTDPPERALTSNRPSISGLEVDGSEHPRAGCARSGERSHPPRQVRRRLRALDALALVDALRSPPLICLSRRSSVTCGEFVIGERVVCSARWPNPPRVAHVRWVRTHLEQSRRQSDERTRGGVQ